MRRHGIGGIVLVAAWLLWAHEIAEHQTPFGPRASEVWVAEETFGSERQCAARLGDLARRGGGAEMEFRLIRYVTSFHCLPEGAKPPTGPDRPFE